MSEHKTLADSGFKVGDLVFYSSVKDSSGGVIYQIVEDTEPVKPAFMERKVMRKRSVWDAGKNDFVFKMVEDVEYGAWDEKGKKLMAASRYGFIRLKPVFDFFATKRGKNPKGKGKTLIVHYYHIKSSVKKVDLVELGAKYVELGNIMRDIVKAGTAGIET